MENMYESLPPFWIVNTVVMGGSEVRLYTNLRTGQKIYSEEDVNRYAEYVKRSIPVLHTSCIWQASLSIRIAESLKLNADPSFHIGKKPIGESSSGAAPTSAALQNDHALEMWKRAVSEGKRRGRKIITVGASSSSPATTLETLHQDRALRASGCTRKRSKGRKRRVDFASIILPAAARDSMSLKAYYGSQWSWE